MRSCETKGTATQEFIDFGAVAQNWTIAENEANNIDLENLWENVIRQGHIKNMSSIEMTAQRAGSAGDRFQGVRRLRF
ncbi:hypothetical protein AOQ73_27860 [Bradyrhizobium pachyrhizi]|nr:hypothetical protein AOQ73_27860 [Bradyrhizobium pachyrhizi]